MKKKAGMIAGVLLTALLTGCVPVVVRVEEGSSHDAQLNTPQHTPAYVKEGEGYVVETGLVSYGIQLPEQYFITYEVYNGKGTIDTISKAVDGVGNIYYKFGEEYLFIKEGNGYILYQPQRGAFMREGDTKYTKSYIEELTVDFDDYIKKGKGHLIIGKDSVQTGTTEVAGRTCDIYSLSVRFANFTQKYQYAIDQETYACLEVKSEKDISGFKSEGDDGFTCIRFDMAQIDLKSEFLAD